MEAGSDQPAVPAQCSLNYSIWSSLRIGNTSMLLDAVHGSHAVMVMVTQLHLGSYSARQYLTFRSHASSHHVPDM